jgi:hypothetical protein
MQLIAAPQKALYDGKLLADGQTYLPKYGSAGRISLKTSLKCHRSCGFAP